MLYSIFWGVSISDIVIPLLIMKRNTTIIIVTDEEGGKKNYTTLTECCRTRDKFSYHYLKRIKLPHLYKGLYYIERMPLNND